MTLQNIIRRADRRQLPRGVALLQHRDNLLPAPRRVALSHPHDRIDDRLRCRLWAAAGSGRSRRQARGAFSFVAADHGIPRFSTDAVPIAQLGHREQLSLIIADELHPFVHGGPFSPGHRTSSA